MKLALVHDWLKDMSGAERVLMELHRIFPDAPLYTLFYDEKFTKEYFPNAEIRASFLQKIPLIAKIYPVFAWLMPMAVESFDLSDFECVLSSSASFSKGLVLKPSTKHVCYCYSPTRMLWDWHAEYKNQKTSFVTKIYQHVMRLWDRSAADRVDQFIAISSLVQNRIKKYYRRDSLLIYPPVSVAEPSLIEILQKDFYLIVSRLFPHKNIDKAIEAFNSIGYPLVVIGDGPELGKLKKSAKGNITFLNRVNDKVLAAYYKACRAFVMPQEEDFGLTPLEAMSFGKPVVALKRGGALETIKEGVHGEFFSDPIPEAILEAVRRLNEKYTEYNSEIIKSQAKLFSPEIFEENIRKVIC